MLEIHPVLAHPSPPSLVCSKQAFDCLNKFSFALFILLSTVHYFIFKVKILVQSTYAIVGKL